MGAGVNMRWGVTETGAGSGQLCPGHSLAVAQLHVPLRQPPQVPQGKVPLILYRPATAPIPPHPRPQPGAAGETSGLPNAPCEPTSRRPRSPAAFQGWGLKAS